MPTVSPEQREASRQELARREAARQRKAQAILARHSLLDFVRLTLPGYKPGWVHRRICNALERFSLAVERGEGPRLILTMPPRHGKTVLVSQRFPVWHMARNAGHEIVCSSYGQELADDNSRDARQCARSQEAIEAFPSLRVAKPDRSAPANREELDKVTHWKTGNGSSYKAVGVGGPITGRGGHICIIDDPHKDRAEADSQTKRDAVWAWYRSTLYTRLAPGGGILVIATRWHEDDLIGRLLKASGEGGDQWEVLDFAAIAEEDEEHREAGDALHPARFPLSRLKRIRAALGEREWNSLYMCRPSPPEGLKFRRTLWGRYHGRPVDIAPQAIEIALTIDCANEEGREAARSVIGVVGKFKTPEGIRYRALDEMAGQWELPELVEAFRFMARKWPRASVAYVEYAANGIALVQLTQREGLSIAIVPVKPRGDASFPGGSKEDRAQYTLTALHAGMIELPADEHAQTPEGYSWADAIIEEHAAFPAGRYKDRVDVWSQLMIRWQVCEPSGMAWLEQEFGGLQGVL